jgi:transcriptional regulator with XRE-family HTH domain
MIMPSNTASGKTPRPRYSNGAEIKRRREQAGLSQGALAELIGTKQKEVGHWEADDYGCGPEMLVALADELKCKPTDLMHEDGRNRYADLLKALGGKVAA